MVGWWMRRILVNVVDSLYNGIANKTDERTRSRVPKGVSTCIARRLKTLLMQWFDW